MSEVLMVPDCNRGNNNSSIDSALLMSMMNNGGFGNGGWMWIIFLFFLEPFMRNGWFGNNGYNNGGFGGPGSVINTIDNTAGRELLQQAIAGNRDAIAQLSSMLSTSTEFVQQAICGVEKSIAQLSGQVGLSGQQTINAIQQGNMSLASQLSSCCCDIREAITRGNYENQLATLNQTNVLQNAISSVSTGLERGFSQTAYETAAQTCALQSTIKDSTNDSTHAILAKLDQIQTNALQDKIAALQEKNTQQATALNNAHQTTVFSQMINQATAPLGQALAGLTKEVADVQCKLPQTVTLPYSCATAVPTCVAAQYGLYGLGSTNFGLWG